MTDECSQRRYGRSVNRHREDEFIHSKYGGALFVEVCEFISFPNNFRGGFQERTKSSSVDYREG